MTGYVADIEELTERNSDFQRVLYIGRHVHLVLMALQPGDDIVEEVQASHDQFLLVEQGEGQIVIDGATNMVKVGDAIVVPAGARHNLRNSGDAPLKVYTLHDPPHHVDHLVQAEKAMAEASSEEFDGATTE